MKIFKRILIILAILLLVISAIGLLFFPGKIHMERSIVINQKQEMVFNFVNNIKNWNSWSPWHDMDTTTEYTYEGPDSGTGASMKWSSKHKDVGSGSMKFTASIPPSSIKEDLNFMKNGTAQVEFKFEPAESGTKVTWTFNTEAGANPLMRIMGSFIDKMVGPDYEKGLAKLKAVLESMPSAPGINVEMTHVKAIHYLAVRDTASAATIGMKIGQHYGEIGAVLKKQKLNMAGAPFAIYYSGGPGQMLDFDAAISIDRSGKTEGKVTAGEIKEGEAAMARYFGAYDKVHVAYDALHQYIGTNKLTMAGAPWEIYVTDPGAEKDTAKWETDVYFPVSK